MKYLYYILPLLVLTACNNAQQDYYVPAKSLLQTGIISRADGFLHLSAKTISDTFCIRSEGSRNDYFSEGDYWWPDPKNPDGPYIKKDGLSNPDNFIQHRLLLHSFSDIAATLASAYKITKDDKYALAASRHIYSWLIDSLTSMHPSLNYSQAIKGIVPGRKVGVIDGIHLIEVAMAIDVLKTSNSFPGEYYEKSKLWFAEYLNWLINHPFGIEEMQAKNNHGTTWLLQAAVFAEFTQNEEVIQFCKDRLLHVTLPDQMAIDGSFPLELERTKPYGYSLFNLDAMAAICQVLSNDETNLWKYASPDGKGMEKALEFIVPYIEDKTQWPYPPDVMYYENWPVAHPFLLFAADAFDEEEYYKLWAGLDHFPETYEIVRNLPVRNPLIWFKNE